MPYVTTAPLLSIHLIQEIDKSLVKIQSLKYDCGDKCVIIITQRKIEEQQWMQNCFQSVVSHFQR